MLGELVDLSPVGLRARSAEKPAHDPGEMLQVGIENGSQTVRVAGRVVWVRRVSGSWQIGVEFINIRPPVAAAITQMARFGFVNTSTSTAAAQGSASGGAVRASIQVEDLYAALGVARDAGEAEIRAAYHKLARTHHPDVSDAPGAAERFALISKSYSVLRNPTLRARYDAMLRNAA